MSNNDSANYTTKYRFLFQCIRPHLFQWLLFLLLSIFVSVSGILIAITTRKLIDTSMGQGFDRALIWIITFGLILLLQFAARALNSYMSLKLNETMINAQQQKFIKHLLGLNWLDFNTYHSGDLQTRITNDINKIIQIWLGIIPGIITLTVQFITAFITLYIFDPRLAVSAFVITPVAIIVSTLIGQHLRKIQMKIQTAESEYRSSLNDVIRHNTIIKAFSQEEEMASLVSDKQLTRLKHAMHQARFTIFAQTTMRIAYGLGFFLAFVWGSYQISSDMLTFGTFTAFLQLIGQVQSPIDGLARSIPTLIKSYSSIDRILQIYRLPLETLIPDKALPTYHTIPTLHINNLRYGYNPLKIILKDIHLSIEAGEHCVILGESGAGKTTLIRLLLGFLSPVEGSLELRADASTYDVSSQTRQWFSYVPQGDTLLTGTIRDNLLIGHPSATQDQINQALDLAAIKDYVDSLPNGLDTTIGENDMGLSQGQAQRISIARALLSPAPVLILDEATSALDLNTEEQILTGLRELKDRSIITITHRTSVLELCDSAYLLSKGVLKKQA